MIDNRIKHLLGFGFSFLIIGIILFSSAINAAKENQKGSLRMISSMLIFSLGVGCFIDLVAGEREEEKSQKELKDYSKELIDELNNHLQVNEIIEKHLTFIQVKASSLVKDQYFGLAAATNKRILIYKTKLGGHKLKSLNYTKVSAVEYEEGLMFDSLEFSTSGEKLSIDKINKGSTADFVGFVNTKI